MINIIDKIKALGSDIYGNKFEIDNNFNIFLTLSNKNKKLSLGKINFLEVQAGSPAKTINQLNFQWVKSERESDIFKKNNSWSIPWYLLDCFPDNTQIVFNTSKNTYSITKKKAVECGSFLWFKLSGFEKKVYIPIQYWNIYDLRGGEPPKRDINIIQNVNLKEREITYFIEPEEKNHLIKLDKKDNDIKTWLDGIDEGKIFSFIASLEPDLKLIDFRKETYHFKDFIDIVSKISKAFPLSFPQISYYLTNYICINSGGSYGNK